MPRRAYRPRQSTLDLVRRLERLTWVDRVEIVAPHRGTAAPNYSRPASLLITRYAAVLTGEKPREYSMAQARRLLTE